MGVAIGAAVGYVDDAAQGDFVIEFEEGFCGAEK